MWVCQLSALILGLTGATAPCRCPASLERIVLSHQQPWENIKIQRMVSTECVLISHHYKVEKL